MPDTLPLLWKPASGAAAPAWNRPGALTAMTRGALGRCPCCGQTRLFTGWLRQAESCAACHAPLGAVRADDAPPYFVIFLVGHLMIATLVLFDARMGLSVTAECAIFLPLTAVLSLALLRPVKGALIGLMLQLGMAATDASDLPRA
jgi:uncharacterized protein (DUF983 family)